MSYIGKKPSDITRAIATNDTFTGDGSTTTFTLSQGAASANDLTVVVNNVRQEPGSGSKSYTLTAPTSLVFNTAPVASDEIYVINPTQVEAIVRAGDISSGVVTGQTAETTPADGDTLLMFDASATALRKITKANLTAIADSAITSGKIADDAVTLAKMAPGTDGNLITYDASGNPAAVATGSAGQILTSAGAGAPPTFAAAATQLAGWSSNSGNLLPADAAKGIYLGVNSATAANLLNDYEEGTWTPAFANAGSASFNSNGQQGYYTKVGRLVTVGFNISIAGLGGGSGGADITGLPFAASNTPTSARYVGTIGGDDNWGTDLSGNNTILQIYGDYLNTRIFLQKNNCNNKADISLADIGTSRVLGTITYFTDA